MLKQTQPRNEALVFLAGHSFLAKGIRQVSDYFMTHWSNRILRGGLL